MDRTKEALRQGLKYAFTSAALFEALDMLREGSMHLQALSGFESGLVLGAGFAVFGYVHDNHGAVTIQLEDEQSLNKAIEQSDGKIAAFPFMPPRPRF